jgi:hypothetical protein
MTYPGHDRHPADGGWTFARWQGPDRQFFGAQFEVPKQRSLANMARKWGF